MINTKTTAIIALAILALTAGASAVVPQWIDEKCELQEFLTQEQNAGIPTSWLNSYLYRTCMDVNSPLTRMPQFTPVFYWTQGQRSDYTFGSFYCGYRYRQQGWRMGTFWTGFYTGKPDGTLLYAAINGEKYCVPFDYYRSKFPNVLWTENRPERDNIPLP